MPRIEDASKCEYVDHAIFGGIVAVLGIGAAVLFAHNIRTSPLDPTVYDWVSVFAPLLIGVAGVWYTYRSIRCAHNCQKGS